MNEPFESELRRFAPAPPDANLSQRIEAALASDAVPAQRNDRWLMGAMSLGLAAAVAIVAMLALDFRPQSNAAPVAAYAADNSLLAQTRLYLAQLSNDKDSLAPRMP